MRPEPRTNAFGQPVGEPLPDWRGCPAPAREIMRGRFCTLEPLDAERHSPDLFEAYAEDDGSMWTYLADGPYATRETFTLAMSEAAESADPLYFAIVDRASGRALGRAAYLRIQPAAGSIEVGSIAYAPRLKRTPVATEAMYLMMQRAFDELGYRRYEWKCDALNEPSRRAAERLGFSYEGLFRQALVYKGRNRDTAWYAIIDQDWPAIRRGFERWFDPANFDNTGQQKLSLASCMGSARELG
ncbi:MAG: GNAT family N-acetyltransferase [Pseudomonadales bacterium]